METERTQNLKECKEITTPLYCCLILARAHSTGAFINYIYTYMQARENKKYV